MKYLNYLFLLPYVLAVVLPVILYFRWRPILSHGASFIFISIFAALGSIVVVRVVEMFLLFPIIHAIGLDRNPTIIAEQSISSWLVLLFEIIFVAGFGCLVMQKLRTNQSTLQD